MDVIKQTYTINASISSVWEALTNPKLIEKWSGDKAEMDLKVGGKFRLWSGDMYGTNIEIVPNKKLAQNWYEKGWDKPSTVIFTLSEKNKVTTVKLVHKDIPSKEYDDLYKGWEDYYMNPLKELVENS